MDFLYKFSKILWTFSIFLESVSILPQLFLLRRSNNVDVITADYVFLMGTYESTHTHIHSIYRVPPPHTYTITHSQFLSLSPSILPPLLFPLPPFSSLPPLFPFSLTYLSQHPNEHLPPLSGAYRALYIANWVYRYFTEPDYSNVLVWVAGSVQTIIYLDFFYYYLQRCVRACV